MKTFANIAPLSMKKSSVLASVGIVSGISGFVYLPLFFVTYWVGLVNFLKSPRFARSYLWAFGLIGVFYLSNVINGAPLSAYIRTSQMLVAIIMAVWLSRQSPKFFVTTVQYAAYICILFIGLEFILNSGFRNAVFSLNYNYIINSGLVTGVMLMKNGNNYAAATSGLIAISLFAFRERGLFLALLLISLSTGSRGLVVAYLLCWGYYYFVPQKSLVFFTTVFFCQPVFLLIFDAMIDDTFRQALYILSQRYVSYVAFTEMGLDHLFGVGMFQGPFHSEYFKFRWPTPAHNTYLSVLGEAGIVGYAMFYLFILSIAQRVQQCDKRLHLIFIYTLVVFFFLNGFTMWEFWFPLSLFLAQGMTKISFEKTNLGSATDLSRQKFIRLTNQGLRIRLSGVTTG